MALGVDFRLYWSRFWGLGLTLIPLGFFFMHLGFDFEPPNIDLLLLAVNFDSLRVYFWPLGVDF